MILPCETCKHKTVRGEGYRQFIGCDDQERKDKNFHEDTYLYRHTCDAYEKEEEGMA